MKRLLSILAIIASLAAAAGVAGAATGEMKSAPAAHVAAGQVLVAANAPLGRAVDPTATVREFEVRAQDDQPNLGVLLAAGVAAIGFLAVRRRRY